MAIPAPPFASSGISAIQAVRQTQREYFTLAAGVDTSPISGLEETSVSVPLGFVRGKSHDD